MATPLDKLIVRESTEMVDERNILIALTEDQRVSFRLKGMKSGVVSIPIAELYGQLSGIPGLGKSSKPVSFKRAEKTAFELPSSVVLNRLRSLNMVTPCDLDLKQRLNDLIDEYEEELNKQLEFKNSKHGNESTELS